MTQISLRRLRQDTHIRALTRGARPHAEQFIQPLFVVEGIAAREIIPGLTGGGASGAAACIRKASSNDSMRASSRGSVRCT